jgi:hypothetical protein
MVGKLIVADPSFEVSLKLPSIGFLYLVILHILD